MYFIKESFKTFINSILDKGIHSKFHSSILVQSIKRIDIKKNRNVIMVKYSINTINTYH